MNFIPLNGWPQLKDIPEKLEHFREVYARFAKVNRWYRSIEETELTGNPVIFDKALKLNALELNVDLLPIQSGSGDPSPTNVRPISGRTSVNLGRTGKNMAKFWKTGYISNAGVYTSDTANAMSYPVFLKGGVTYTAKTNSGVTIASFNGALFTGFDGTNLTGFISRLVEPSTQQTTITFSPSVDCWMVCSINLAFQTPSAENYETVYKVQIEDGATATEYEPYTGITLTIALGTTVYGGTLDVKTGGLTITHKYYLIEAFGSKSSSTDVDQYLYTVTESKSGAIPICNKCLGVDAAHIFDPTITAPVCGFAATTPTVFRFSLPTSMEIDTIEKVNEYIGDGLQICYELATPTTVQLTGEELEMLKGYNYISTDADSLTVKAYTI